MKLRSILFVTLFVLFALFNSANPCAAQANQSTQETTTLEPNKPIERSLKGGETHSYKIKLKAGEYFHVDVDQRGIDILLALVGADGKVIIERDRPNGTQGAESLSFIAATAGDYRLDVKALEEKAEAGKYEIKSDAVRSATATDKKRIEAETIFQDGQRLSQSEKVESALEACTKYEAAATLWREIGDKYAEALTQASLGYSRESLGDYKNAVAAHEKALALYQGLNDRWKEVATLHNLCVLNGTLGEFEKSIRQFKDAKKIYKELRDMDGEKRLNDQFESVTNIYFEKASDSTSKIDTNYTQRNLDVYFQKAFDFLLIAREMYQALEKKDSESAMLFLIGKLNNHIGNIQKAVEYYNQALSLIREVGDKNGEVIILNNTAQLYFELGDTQKVFEYSNQVLALVKESKNKSAESAALNNIGGAYTMLGQYAKSLEYLNQALVLSREVGDKQNEAQVLDNIGYAYSMLGDIQKALEHHNLSLSLHISVENKLGESFALINIGIAHYRLGEKQKALDYVNRALLAARGTGNKRFESLCLSNMMVIWHSLQNPKYAVFYGKQSINSFQQLRSNIKSLDKELQNTFLKSVEGNYRYLAYILIEQGRIPEAQAVLDLLKDEEFSGLVRRSNDNKGDAAVPYSKEEAKAVDISNRLADIGREYDDLLEKGKKGLLDDAGIKRRDLLREELTVANKDYQNALAALAAATVKPEDLGTIVKAAKDFQADLLKLGRGTVALYTVIVKDEKDSTKNGWVILVTPSFQRVYPIDVTDLEQTVFAFRAALSNPAYDPAPLAQKLYKMLFLQTSEKQKITLAQDLETYLNGQTNKTLMWSLDGVLRYVPIAALHDGKQYLVESYQNTVFNSAGKTRLTSPVNKNWTAFGLGVSEKREEAGITFYALPGTERELKKIIKAQTAASGILPGVVKENKDFTQKAMLDGLLNNNFSVVHISSHFSYQPANNEQSFLLLGQGRFTAKDMNEQPTPIFADVDLVTLSACDTAMGNANGKDAESFAFLVQQLGAKSVIASLWPVDDIGTQVLMPEFYRLRETGLTKIEALRKAQLALLNGEIKEAGDGVNRAKVVGVGDNKYNLKPYTKDPAKPFAHPYYWAPFILIGNWK